MGHGGAAGARILEGHVNDGHVSPLVSFRGVSARVGQKEILHNLSFDVEAGETLVLLGRSGSGKTTALKMVNGLLLPSAGEVSIEVVRTTAWDLIRLRRRIGYVIQEAGLFPHFTVGENVSLVLRLLGWDENKKRERTRSMLDLVRLDPDKFADRYPHELSGGQRQRVGVARALAADPQIVLLDEPFGALDAITRTSIQKEFAHLVRDLGKTAVFVTHDLHEAMLLGSRIALMDKGKIVLLETPENFAKSDQPLARAYLETVSV